MAKLGDLIQTDDFKTEKHVPVIEVGSAKKGEPFEVKVSVGKEVSHPNTSEHFIKWIKLYFKPEDEKFAYEVGANEFGSHGASTKGPNTGPIYSNPVTSFNLKVEKAGTLIAESYCNIHGLWQNSQELKV